MKKAWHPHQDTMDDLLAQIQDGQRFATYIRTPNTELQLIAMAEKLILDTQQFEAEYKAWKRLPEKERSMWPSFAKFWATAYDGWKETSKSAAKLGFGS